jgi:hypothetical protein
VRGFHAGDGSFFFTYAVEPSKSGAHVGLPLLRPRPCWAITDPSEPFLKSFKHTFEGGSIKPVGPSESGEYDCKQFQLTNTKSNFNKVIPFFSSTSFPEVKQRQFETFRHVVDLLIDQRHLTVEGFTEFIDLTYAMNENSKRNKSSQHFIELGTTWINRHNSTP